MTDLSQFARDLSKLTGGRKWLAFRNALIEPSQIEALALDEPPMSNTDYRIFLVMRSGFMHEVWCGPGEEAQRAFRYLADACLGFNPDDFAEVKSQP